MKQTTRLVWAAIVMAAPALSMAAGKITFNGNVTDQTCSLGVGSNADMTVKLPTVSMAQLSSSGKTAGLTPFTVTVENCKPETANLKINTVFSGATLTANGNLVNTLAESGGAKNVEVQLLNDASGSDASVIKLTSVTSVEGLELKTGDTSASYEFAARYYAADAATVGKVNAFVNYDITYE